MAAEKSPSRRRLAVERLRDQPLLVQVATGDADADVRWTAVERLEDATALESVARSDRSWIVRRLAVGRLSDQSVVLEIAERDEDSSVRRAAVENLTSQDALARIVRDDPDPRVRVAAAMRVKEWGAGDREVLGALVEAHPSLRASLFVGDGISVVGLDGRTVRAESGDVVSVMPGVEHRLELTCRGTGGGASRSEVRLVPQAGGDYVVELEATDSPGCRAVARQQ